MKRLVLLVLAVVTLSGASAEPLTLQAAVDQAVSRNVDYQSALLAVDKARAGLSDLVNWKQVAVSATQTQSSDNKVSPTTSLGVSLPLFDQLGASATVDQTGAAKVALTATPLAHSDTATQAQITYDKALLLATQARVTLETAVRKAWLAQASATAQWEVQTKTTALKETAYQDAKARYDKGTVTLAEVRSALKDWTDARSTQTTLDRTLVKAKAELAALLQVESAELAPLDASQLQALVDGLGTLDASAVGTSVRLQALEVDAQRAKADAVWLLDPSLSVAATALIPAAGSATWSGSVTLGLSLGSWQGSDKALADRSVDLARQTLAAQTVATRSAQAQALLAVQTAVSTVESRELALTQARDLLQETALLVKAGKATALDLDEATLGVTSAENDVFQAWADVYSARLDLNASRS